MGLAALTFFNADEANGVKLQDDETWNPDLD